MIWIQSDQRDFAFVSVIPQELIVFTDCNARLVLQGAYMYKFDTLHVGGIYHTPKETLVTQFVPSMCSLNIVVFA